MKNCFSGSGNPVIERKLLRIWRAKTTLTLCCRVHFSDLFALAAPASGLSIIDHVPDHKAAAAFDCVHPLGRELGQVGILNLRDKL
jgi:hypothetical protein